MTILDFLKTVFASPNELEEVSLKQLDDWLETKIKTKSEIINKQMPQFKKRLEEKKRTLLDAINELENAKYNEKQNIPLRAKQTIDGHRKIFKQKTMVLIDKLQFPDNDSEINNSNSRFLTELEIFAQNTSKNHQIISELFGNEISKVSINLNQIDIIFKNIKHLFDKNSITDINELKEYFKQFKQKIALKNELKKEIEKFNEDILLLKTKIKTIEDKIAELKENNAYKNLMKSHHEKKEILSLKESLTSQLKLSFSKINRALKKYEHISLQYQLLRKYIDDPLDALLKDESLEIVKLLQAMKQSINKEKLTLQDSEKQKITLCLNKLDSHYFLSFLQKYTSYNNTLKTLDNKIKQSEILEQIQTEKRRLDFNKSSLEQVKKRFEKLQHKYESINVKELTNKLQMKLNEKKELQVKLL